VQETLGESDVRPAGARKKSNPTSRKYKPVPLTRERALEIFKPEILEARAKSAKWLEGAPKLIKVWPYYDSDGLIDILDARFEQPDGKKAVITFFYDGQTLRSAGAPVLLYNRNLIAADSDTPVLIVEGAKAAQAAAAVPGFIPVTWNGGGKKCKQANWSPLKDRTVYIYPDDDQKVYGEKHAQAGELMPPHEQPGIATALDIKKKLPDAVIVQPIESARKIKADGSDIVEVMQVPNMTPQAISEYILNAPEITAPKSDTPPSNPIDTPRAVPDPDFFPFRILGVADDGKGYFLDRHERLTSMSLGSITQNKLLTLASLTFWQAEYATGKGGKLDRDDWTAAIDSVIQMAGQVDFNPDRIRGRGAWRERDGRICYHDGLNTIGDMSPERLYLRMTRKDIGLDSAPPDLNALKDILGITEQLSFETRADMIRCIAWSTLAPFAGALPWRPAGLLTGRSESGKSTIVDMIIKPLAGPFIVSGGESTEAGIRQAVNINSMAIVVEEAETDTQKKKGRRDDILSLMRQSTSDETPKAVKGTIDGKGMRFTLRSMFMFVAISPEVESIADDNRLFRVNLEGKGHTPDEWYKLGVKLTESITPELCAGVRAMTWKRLHDIFEMANTMSPIIQKVTGKSSRYSKAESLLFAAYQIVWKNADALEEDDLYRFFEQIYDWQPVEQTRKEEEELLDRLLDEIIREGKDTYTLRTVLQRGYSGKAGDPEIWKNIAGRYGLRVTADGDLAMAKKHHEITRIISRGTGYHRIFWRHPLIKDKNKTVHLAGVNRSCLIIDKQVLTEQGEDVF
jgi:hypothetical protein